jgi:hypothetical protein
MAKRTFAKTRTTPAAINTIGNAAQRSAANRVRSINRNPLSRRIQSVSLEFECTSCHTIFEVKYLAVPNSVTCPKCRRSLGSYSGNDSSGAFLPMRIVVRCWKCNQTLIVSVGTESVHLAKEVEGTPAGHSTIAYLHDCCSAKAFDILIRPGEAIIYHWTFCSVNFQSKYAWERHASTSHEPQVAWICCKTTVDRTANLDICLFCSEWLQTEDHCATKHKIRECRDQGLCNRVFFRKDQLTQHLHHFHRKLLLRDMDREWRVQINLNGKTWRCGVCGAIFYNWKERAKHIGGHWEEGLDMKSWKKFHQTRGPVLKSYYIRPEDSRTAENLEPQDRDYTLNRMNKTNRIRQFPDSVDMPSHQTRGTVSKSWNNRPEDCRTAEDFKPQDRDVTLNRMNQTNRIRPHQLLDPVDLPSQRTRGTVSRFFSKIKRMLPGGSDTIYPSPLGRH